MKIFDVKSWVDNPEKKARLFRIAFLIATGMTVLGFVLIIMALFFPGLIL